MSPSLFLKGVGIKIVRFSDSTTSINIGQPMKIHDAGVFSFI